MTLANLLATNPSWPDSLTDTQALAWLRESVVTYQDIPWLELQLWLTDQGIPRAALENAAATGTNANRTAAQHILDVIDAGESLAASDARVRAVVQASALDGTAKAALVALAQVDVVRLIQAGMSEQDDASWLYHIAQARP